MSAELRDRLVLGLSARAHTTADLAAELGVTRAVAYQELTALRVDGLVKTLPSGAWGLTSAGYLRRDRLSASRGGRGAIG